MTLDSGRCQVAILAGGMGTRLKARTGSIPKPMARVLGRPVLEHLIELCQRAGFTRIALLVHYEYQVIRDYFGTGERWGVELVYCVEQNARGTAGALLDALPELESRFLVLYGDTYADVDLKELWRVHDSSGAAATLLLHPNDHPHDSDLVEVDAQCRIVSIKPYPHADVAAHRNLVNAALYVIEATAVQAGAPREGKADLAKQAFPALLKQGVVLHAYVTPEYVKDMGTPERLDKVEADIRSGLPDRLSSRRPRQAVFIDRDGTLNEEVNHLRSPDQLCLLPGAASAVRRLNRAGMLAIGVTNQPVLARGDVTPAGLEAIHSKLDAELGAAGAYLDRLYVCPHHPDAGFPNEVTSLKIRCDCRKPEAGLLDRAVRELNIDRRSSWMVGDTSADILAGRRAGMRTIGVRTGHACEDDKYEAEPDFLVPDLASAVDWVLQDHAALAAKLAPVACAARDARFVLVGGLARSGKSMAARVLCELLGAAGRTCHVINLDGWLKPFADRPDWMPVLDRYDLASAAASLLPLANAHHWRWIGVPRYDRRARLVTVGPSRAIGERDLVIVEGVPALLDWPLRGLADVRLFVDVPEPVRQRRLAADYAWRGVPSKVLDELQQQRELSEVRHVRTSAAQATHHIDTGPAS